VVCIIGAAGAYLYLFSTDGADIDAAEILPADTVFMIQMSELESKLNAFKEGQLGRTLMGIDWSRVLKEMDVGEDDIKDFNHYRDAAADFFDSLFFKEVFGKKMVMAFRLPGFEDIESPDDLRRLLDAIVLVSYPRHNTKLLDMVSRYSAMPLALKTETADGWQLSSFEVEGGLRVYFGITKGALVATLGRDSLLTCLRQSQNPGQSDSLAGTANYTELKKRLFNHAHAGSFAYGNFELLQAKLIDLLEASDIEQEATAELESLWGALKGMPAGGMVFLGDDPRFRHSKSLLLMDKNRLSPMVAKTLSIPAQENRTLELTPRGALLHGWRNNFDPETIWKTIVREGNLKAKDIRRIEMQVQNLTGVNLDQLLGAFGQQFAIVIQDIITGGLFPLPQLTFMTEVRQPETIHTGLANLTRNLGTPLKQEDYNGVSISYIGLPFLANLSPAYCIHNNFFILASNRDLLKQCVETDNGGQNLTTDPAFQAVDKGLSDTNSAIVFIHSARINDRLQDVAKWGSTMAVHGNPNKGQRIDILVNQIVLPILTALKTYESIGMRSVISADQVLADLYISCSN
jgi:hypothetical protein